LAKRKPTKRRKKVPKKRRPSTRRVKKRKTKIKISRKKFATKTIVKKKPFGGYNIIFAGCEETMEEVFGRKPIAPSQMVKILWKYIKKWKLGGKSK